MEDPLLSNIKLLIRSWKMDAARRRALGAKQTMKLGYDDEDREMPTPEGQATINTANTIDQLTAELEHVLAGGELP